MANMCSPAAVTLLPAYGMHKPGQRFVNFLAAARLSHQIVNMQSQLKGQQPMCGIFKLGRNYATSTGPQLALHLENFHQTAKHLPLRTGMALHVYGMCKPDRTSVA